MRLLVPASPGESGPTVVAAGRTWRLVSFGGNGTHPQYIAVSYAWGEGRVAHPFGSGVQISNRAWPVLDTAARQAKDQSLWLDALCVPTEEPDRAATLRELARIYANAEEVVVVLSSRSMPLFEECELRRPVSFATLQRLEEEAWVRRFWTYQELARSQAMSFLVEGAASRIDGISFLNHVGEALHRAGTTGTTLLPALDNFLDVLASWIHTGSEPFAYQVMAGMAQRTADRPADRFNAVLGAIDPTGSFLGAEGTGAAAEQFMAACEAKGDFSFIYTTSVRSRVPGRSWRPEAGELPPVFAWHTFGAGQPGRLTPTHLALQNLYLAPRGPLSDKADAFLRQWLARFPQAGSGEPTASAVLQSLTTMGYNPEASAVPLKDGYFFPANLSQVAPGWAILVALGVRWVAGSPGLLVEALPSRRYRCRDTGVFVGPVDQLKGKLVELE